MMQKLIEKSKKIYSKRKFKAFDQNEIKTRYGQFFSDNNNDNQIFDDVNKIKIDDLPNLKNDKLLNKCYKELIQMKEDNQKTREIKVFKEIISSSVKSN